MKADTPAANRDGPSIMKSEGDACMGGVSMILIQLQLVDGTLWALILAHQMLKGRDQDRSDSSHAIPHH